MKKFKQLVRKGYPEGRVSSVYYSIARVEGLQKVKFSEIIVFESGARGQVMSSSEAYVQVVLLDEATVKTGERCVGLGESLQVPATSSLLGMTINPLGESLVGSFGKGRYEKRKIDVPPPTMAGRKLIKDQFMTGIKIIDLMLPLAFGQRQLIIGNRKTGKTPFLLQSAKSMVKAGGLVVYSCIGSRLADIAMLEKSFETSGIREKTVIVASSASDAPGMVYLCPYVAMTIAEYFRDQGANVLVILDDMTTHAKNYREISLLSGTFPGRDSYPGDIFYAHSKLMERAGNFEVMINKQPQEASITCLPVAHMVMGDFSGYIQTNLMAMTDGHIYFDTERYNKGIFPAINPFLSVTRVGRQTQNSLLKDAGLQITHFLVRVGELEQFAHFGAELSSVTRKDIDTGEKLQQLLQQEVREFVDVNSFLFILALLFSGIWKDISLGKTVEEAKNITDSIKSNLEFSSQVSRLIDSSGTFSHLVYEIEKNPELYRKYIGSLGSRN